MAFEEFIKVEIVKEEAEDAGERYAHVPEPAGPGGDCISSGVNDLASQSKSQKNNKKSRSEVGPNENDVVFSLRDEEYKQRLLPGIKMLAELRFEGRDLEETLQRKKIADEHMSFFREKIQRGNGRFLKHKNHPFIELNEAKAKTKLLHDLGREAKNIYDKLMKKKLEESKKRYRSVNSPSPTKKKSKSASKNSPESRNSPASESRPKRGIQQFKDKNLPYTHHLDSSGPNGSNVSRYDKNSAFKRGELVKSDKHMLECAGQLFARELVKRKEWYVKYCQVIHDEWNFIAYKDCGHCNGNELDAEEGEGKFTGYDELAKYVFQTEWYEQLMKDSVELREVRNYLDVIRVTFKKEMAGVTESSNEETKHTSSKAFGDHSSEGGTSGTDVRPTGTEENVNTTPSGAAPQAAEDQRDTCKNKYDESNEATTHSTHANPPGVNTNFEESMNTNGPAAASQAQNHRAQPNNNDASTKKPTAQPASDNPLSAPTTPRNAAQQTRVDNNVNTTPPPPAAAAAASQTHTTQPTSDNKNDTKSTPQPKMTSFIQKFDELKEKKEQVNEMLSHAKEKFHDVQHVWKRNQAIDLYNALNRWLICIAKDRSAIRGFESNQIQCVVDKFEAFMENLVSAEENGDEDSVEFFKEIIGSFVEETKGHILGINVRDV